MSCTSCGRETIKRPESSCQNVGHWRAWSEQLEQRFQAKMDFARERFDDIEAALESWRARDGQMRSGDAAPAKKG